MVAHGAAGACEPAGWTADTPRSNRLIPEPDTVMADPRGEA
jgi:hypothetical protein